MLTLVTRSLLITADVIVLAVTWIGTYRQTREAIRAGVHASISAILLRDGKQYPVARSRSRELITQI